MSVSHAEFWLKSGVLFIEKRLLIACISSDWLIPMITFHSESNEVNNKIELKCVIY